MPWADSERRIDDFLAKVAAKKKVTNVAPFQPTSPDLASRQMKEIKLWHNWNASGRKPEHLEPLLVSIQPIIQGEVNRFRGTEIPRAALEAEATKLTVKKLRTFDPTKAQLNTYLKNHIKLDRYAKTYQNIGRIPDAQRDLITARGRAVSELTDELGYVPNTASIAERIREMALKPAHAKVTAKHLDQLEKERKGALVASELSFDPAEMGVSKEMQALGLLRYDRRLSPLEKQVLNMTHGFEGMKPLKPTQIGKALSQRPSKISKIRNKIKALLHETMESI